MYSTGVKGFDFVADLKFLYLMYREWFGRFAMWDEYLFPLINKRGQLVPYTLNAFNLLENKYFKESGVRYRSPYTRKKGTVSLAYDISELTDFDRAMVARHCIADMPRNSRVTTHRYVNADLERVGKNYQRIAIAAHARLQQHFKYLSICWVVKFFLSLFSSRQSAPLGVKRKRTPEPHAPERPKASPSKFRYCYYLILAICHCWWYLIIFSQEFV